MQNRADMHQETRFARDALRYLETMMQNRTVMC